MSELMEEYIGDDKDKKELIIKLINELKTNGMEEEKIKIVVDNFIRNHGDEEGYLKNDYANEDKYLR